MVAVRDFSGFWISACALASAAASAPMLSLQCCMAGLRFQNLKADGAGLRSLGPYPMPRGLLRLLWHKGLELRLGAIVVERSRPGFPIQIGKLRPGIGAAHVDRSDRFDPGPRRLDAEQARGLAALDAAPEFSLRRQKQVLVEWIGRNGHLHPLAAPSDDRQHGRS